MLDIIVFIVVLFFMWKGYQRGFSRELPRLGALVAAIIAGIVFYSVIAVFLSGTPVPDIIGSYTSGAFWERVASEKAKEGKVNQIFGSINSVENKERMVGEFFIMFISLCIIFAVVYCILRRYSRKKNIYRKINVPVQLNPALGGCVGILRGVFYVYLVCAFLVICEPFIPSDFLVNQVDKSEITRVMYEKNYIANIVARQDFLSGGI